MGKQSDDFMPEPGLYGACRFCGQIHTIDDDYQNEEEANEQATLRCDCREAKEYQTMLRRLRDIDKMVNEAFFGEASRDYHLPGSLNAAIRVIAQAVYKGEIESVQLKLDDCRKAAITSKDGRLKILKSTTVKEMEEA